MTMTLAMPMPPTSSATAPRARSSPLNAAEASARAVSAVTGLATDHVLRRRRVRRGGQDGGDRGDARRVGAHVDLHRRRAGVQQPLAPPGTRSARSGRVRGPAAAAA